MPSARIHEAIAKKINKDYNMDELLLRLGSISPDCWRNVELESKVKEKYLTHFWDFRIKEGQANDYTEFYLKYYNELDNPFYFGYLLHLMTDQYWKSYVDPKFFYNENGVKKCILKDGTIIDDKDYFSYYESIKIQKRICKEYNLGILPTNIEEVSNLNCDIDELNLSGLFGLSGTISYINSKMLYEEDDDETIMYNFKDIEKYLSDTIVFIKKELNRLKKIKENEDKKKKIIIDIDVILFCSKEDEKLYWSEFLKENEDIKDNQEYSFKNPILIKFWKEYKDRIVIESNIQFFVKILKELCEKGYRIDLISTRSLGKYAALKKKIVEYLELNNIEYTYLKLGFDFEKELSKRCNYDILVSCNNDSIESSKKYGLTTIVYKNFFTDKDF